MTGEITNALSLELQKLFEGTETTVLRETQFKTENMPLYTVNLVILCMESSPDEGQFIGGVTFADDQFVIKCFSYDYNADLEDDQQINTDAYNLVDTIRKHIAGGNWLTSEMIAVENTYNFKLTLNGRMRSTELEKAGGGMLPGYAIQYESVSIDLSTSFVQTQTYAVTKVEGVTFSGYSTKTNYNWLPDVITFLADLNVYGAITGAVIGDRYYIISEGKIYTVKTINPITHLIDTSTIYAPATNDIFIAADNPDYAWLFDGSNLLQKEMVTEIP